MPTEIRASMACGGFAENHAPSGTADSERAAALPVTVIVPVYRGVEMTRRCLQAAMPGVLAIPGAVLLAVNDASPDEGMQEMLEQLAARWSGRLVVEVNATNQGFVRTVNRGLAQFPYSDVVLLNSDVVVPRDWLGRLIEEAYAAGRIGTVTPFSNNATICSFPHFLLENEAPYGQDVDVVDAVFRLEKLPCVKAPTGVGFCMYIRRACLDEIGYLNEEKFGRGYGEENDLCQRAAKRGWSNLISPNLYAFHKGGASFSSDRQELMERGMQALVKLHRNYGKDVRRFIFDNPLKLARVTRHLQLLSTLSIPKVLHISHGLGGGTTQHISELAESCGQRIANLLLTPHGSGGEVTVSLGVMPNADKITYRLPSEYGALVGLLRMIGVGAIHYHHTFGVDPIVLGLPSELGAEFLLTVHDFYWIGGNPTLTDRNGIYSAAHLDHGPHPSYPLPAGITVEAWQNMLRPHIESADAVIFPSNATKAIFETAYRPKVPVVAPHVEQHINVRTAPREFAVRSRYTIGVLGAIAPEKGADLLEDLAVAARRENANLDFKIIGYSYRPLKEVDATGAYDSRALADLIVAHKLDIVLFPGRCPETYSYTLSYALNSGLPIAAPNIGAFPERLSGRRNTLIFDYLISAEDLLHELRAFIQRLSNNDAATAPLFSNDLSKRDFYAQDYLDIVSRQVRVYPRDSLLPLDLPPERIREPGRLSTSSLRGRLAWIIAELYVLNPVGKRIGKAVPAKMRRVVKRLLYGPPTS